MIIEPPSGAQGSKGLKKMVDDNPPAYSDVEGQARHYSSTRSRSNANLRPAYADVDSQARHYPSRRSRSNANVRTAHADVDSQAHHYPSISNANLSSLPLHPPPTVDQVHVFEPKHDIHGTFYIDPVVPAVGKGKHKSKRPLPHASFRTRNNKIELDLGTTGDFRKAPKANISVSSKSGDIKINILPILPSRPRLSLDASSRHGNVILFLPQGFSGVIQLTTRKGEMVILPALSAIIKTVKSSERETIFMIGAQPNASDSDNTREASFCELLSRTGSITVGLSGHDSYMPPVGFWKKIGGYFGVGDKPSKE